MKEVNEIFGIVESVINGTPTHEAKKQLEAFSNDKKLESLVTGAFSLVESAERHPNDKKMLRGGVDTLRRRADSLLVNES